MPRNYKHHYLLLYERNCNGKRKWQQPHEITIADCPPASNSKLFPRKSTKMLVSSTPKIPIQTILPDSSTGSPITPFVIHSPLMTIQISNRAIDIVEHQTTGMLTASFLNADAKSHTVKLTVDDKDIEQ